MDINRLKADLDFERTKRKNLGFELQQLKQENEELKKQIEFNIKLADDRGQCMQRHWQKLEKIKTLCNVLGYVIGKKRIIQANDILRIIESEDE